MFVANYCCHPNIGIPHSTTESYNRKGASHTFLFFAFFGLIPLPAYVFGRMLPYLTFDTFSIACVLAATTLFLLGATKARDSGQNWLKSGLETPAVGGVAAHAAFLVGRLLGRFA